MTAVIFDVGGVLIDWNPRHLYRKLFAGDGDDAMEWFLAEVCTPEWNLQQDAGRPFAEAVAELTRRFPEHAELIAAYDTRWEEMVRGAHDETIEIVRELKTQGTPLYCLTNFSAEKFPSMRRRFDVFDLFDGIVVSAEIGMVKPDPAAYRYLVERFGLEASSCLFVDDVEANVEAAASIGMQAVRYLSSRQLRRDMRMRGVLASPGRRLLAPTQSP
ncbi:MAG: HAD family hydrolase [Bacteroidota bacterium]|jgi:2-haloacid dehalogenase